MSAVSSFILFHCIENLENIMITFMRKTTFSLNTQRLKRLQLSNIRPSLETRSNPVSGELPMK